MGVACSRLTETAAGFAHQLCGFCKLCVNHSMVSTSVRSPRTPHLTSYYHCVILRKAGVECLSWQRIECCYSGWILLQLIVLGCFICFCFWVIFEKSFQVLVEKHLQLALNKRCALLKTRDILLSTIILMNKAQNAQIQVNSHVIFTVYCHYLHDSGENSHIKQLKQDCTSGKFP